MIASLPSDNSKKVLFGYDTDASMVGLNAPARLVGIFLGDATASTLTTNGWALFDAAIGWAAPAGVGGDVTVRYERDATDRIIARKVNGVTVARYAYSDASDSAAATLDATNAVVERTVGLPGGAAITKRASGDVWSYPNIHGDIIATANSTGTKTGGTYTYDPYGRAFAGTPGNSTGNADYGWLGQHRRLAEHEAGQPALIEMGARPYSPALGRFLEMDPIEGGTTTNDYGYVGDPVNQFDLSGSRLCDGAYRCSQPRRRANAPRATTTTTVHRRSANTSLNGGSACDLGQCLSPGGGGAFSSQAGAPPGPDNPAGQAYGNASIVDPSFTGSEPGCVRCRAFSWGAFLDNLGHIAYWISACAAGATEGAVVGGAIGSIEPGIGTGLGAGAGGIGGYIYATQTYDPYFP